MDDLNNKLNSKVDYFGIDIDDAGVFNFILTYLKLKHDFPDANIEARLSSSHAGYHILVYLKEPITLMEGFLYRGAYGDCINRLKLNFSKLLASEGKEDNNDILFDQKNGKKVYKLDMNLLLKPFTDEISGIMEFWGDDGTLETIRNISLKIEKKIPVRAKWLTMVGIKEGIKADIIKEKLQKICTDILLKDDTFRWRIYKSFHPNEKYALTLFVKDEKEAKKKGGWFYYKTICAECGAELPKGIKGKEKRICQCGAEIPNLLFYPKELK